MGKLISPERASVDEIRAVQLQRLQWSVRHAYQGSRRIRLELTRAGHLDTLTVHVECAGEAAAADDTRKQAASELAQQVKSYIGISVGVEVHPPGVMERSVGKAKRLTDRGRE